MARIPNNNDPFLRLQAMIQQSQPISGLSGGGTYSSGPTIQGLGDGERVVLMAGVGQTGEPEYNPIWGRDGEYVAGTVDGVFPHDGVVLVRWDNGRKNAYRPGRDCKMLPLSHAPQPKSGAFGKKKVELDTTKLEPLIIDPNVKSEIVALLQQHKHGKKIFDDWGLAEVIEYGRGMTIMFWGAPGTGKTFGARCIAKSLGKELLVIGAAEIQSSEPGGANRAIQGAFKAAKEENKVLFIDECDSLISNRANLGMILASEINTLLTEIEKTEDVVILATNRIADMDPALERRLSLIIEFPAPELEQRKAIWRGLIPKKMPLHEDVKIEELAEHKFTGGIIKNIVLQSARLAVSDDSKVVEKKHFVRAMERVKSSQGLMGKQRIQHAQDYSVDAGVGKTIERRVDNFLDQDE